jgi:hypothetical protein
MSLLDKYKGVPSSTPAHKVVPTKGYTVCNGTIIAQTDKAILFSIRTICEDVEDSETFEEERDPFLDSSTPKRHWIPLSQIKSIVTAHEKDDVIVVANWLLETKGIL